MVPSFKGGFAKNTSCKICEEKRWIDEVTFSGVPQPQVEQKISGGTIKNPVNGGCTKLSRKYSHLVLKFWKSTNFQQFCSFELGI